MKIGDIDLALVLGSGLSEILAGGTIPAWSEGGRIAYSPRLREAARKVDTSVREGVYAGLLGPNYETAAEARYLRTIGADAVGMSTVLETIAARSSGMEVFGVSLITNAVAAADTSHAEVTAIAKSAAARLAVLLDGVVAAA